MVRGKRGKRFLGPRRARNEACRVGVVGEQGSAASRGVAAVGHGGTVHACNTTTRKTHSSAVLAPSGKAPVSHSKYLKKT